MRFFFFPTLRNIFCLFYVSKVRRNLWYISFEINVNLLATLQRSRGWKKNFVGERKFWFCRSALQLFFKDKNPSCQHFHLPSSCVFQFFFLLLIIFIFRIVTSKDIFVSLAVETLEITMWKSGLSFSFFFRCFFFSTVQKT